MIVPFQGNSGIEINRGVGYAKPALFWNETVLSWQTVTNIANVSTFNNIGSVTTGVASQLAYYIASNSTVFSTGANLTWNGANLLNITGNVETSGIRLDNINVTPPPAIATTINVIGNTAGNSSGGTGIYFNNNTESGELASKTKAIAYSIIFG